MGKLFFDRLVIFLTAIGAAILAFTMLITTLDVIMRYFFHSPIKGVYEIVELLMGILSPIAILYCSWRKGHVSVDLVYNMLSRKMKKATLILAMGCVLAVMLILAVASVPLIEEVMESRLSTPTLDLPMWPAAFAISISFMLMVPIALAELWQAFLPGAEDKQ